VSGFLQRNLERLPSGLAHALAAAEQRVTDQYIERKARSGQMVTGIVRDGRPWYFHSTYDPKKEAERLAATASDAAICLGFGTGHHLETLSRCCSIVIVIEPDLAAISYALGRVDLSHALSKENVHLVIGDDALTPGTIIANLYLPAIHGSVSVIDLPGRVEADPESFREIRDKIADSLEIVSNDFATQAHLGRLWLRNTLENLAQLVGGKATYEYPVLTGHVVVTAAGPSLAEHLAQIPEDATIIATDTSLPALVGRGVRPAAVIAVDSQPIGYLHGLAADFPDIPLLADIAVAPSVVRAHSRIGPLLSAHPLHGLLRSLGLEAITCDSGAGSVTLTAVDVARILGARRVTVAGADFSYPNGRSYVRGSYIHRWFGLQSSRLEPAQSGMYSFVMDRPGLYRDGDDLRVPVMDRYLSSFERIASQARIPVTRIVSGQTGEYPETGGSSTNHVRRNRITVPGDIFSRLESVFHDRSSAAHGVQWQDPAVGALLPLVAWCRRGDPSADSSRLLQLARDETRRLIAVLRPDR